MRERHWAAGKKLSAAVSVILACIMTLGMCVCVPAAEFEDVGSDAESYDAVAWAVNSGIMDPAEEGRFAPDEAVKQEDVLLYAWRSCGAPRAEADISGLGADDACADALKWAVDGEILAPADGEETGEPAFDAGSPATVAQAVTWLWRANGSGGYNLEGLTYADVQEDSYYYEAVRWAVAEDIYKGVSDTEYGADAEMTRAQLASILYAVKKPVEKGSSAEIAEAADHISAGHIIYLGNDSSIMWRVYDDEKANNGEDGMFLFSQNLLEEKTPLNSADTLFEKKEEAHSYKGSEAQAWCADFAQRTFTEAELEAILSTVKDDEAAQSKFRVENYDMVVNFMDEEKILDGDKVFLLSVEETNSMSNDLRIGYLNGEAKAYGLRSVHHHLPFDQGMIYSNGTAMSMDMSLAFNTRPALNLVTDQILMASPAENGKSDEEISDFSALPGADFTASEWKLTITDPAVAAPEVTEVKREDASVSFSYDKAGGNLSALIKDADGKVVSYGVLDKDTSGQGESTLTLPADWDSNGYKLFVFSETLGEDKASDYASALTEVEVPAQ